MATLDDANNARAQHADDLAKGGAHAIGVEKGASFGKTGWVVIAYVPPGEPLDLPATLKTSHKGVAIEVPLVVAKAEPFEPQ